MADIAPTSSQLPPRQSTGRNVLRLIVVLRVLLPEYRALRRFGADAADNAAPTRFAATLVSPCAQSSIGWMAMASPRQVLVTQPSLSSRSVMPRIVECDSGWYRRQSRRME